MTMFINSSRVTLNDTFLNTLSDSKIRNLHEVTSIPELFILESPPPPPPIFPRPIVALKSVFGVLFAYFYRDRHMVAFLE